MNWKPFLYSVGGATLYFAISEILPEWSHILAGLFGGVVFLAIYCLVPKKLADWKRVSISAVITILIACIVRLVLH